VAKIFPVMVKDSVFTDKSHKAVSSS